MPEVAVITLRKVGTRMGADIGKLIFNLLFLLILLPLSARAQVPVKGDTTSTEEGNIDQSIEDAMTDLETDDQTDWTVFTDQLDDWRRRQLDLNFATEDDLSMLPGFSPIVITNLIDYRERNGALLSVYELQAVPGMTHVLFTRIRPFITVRSSREKDIRRIDEHPAGAQ